MFLKSAIILNVLSSRYPFFYAISSNLWLKAVIPAMYMASQRRLIMIKLHLLLFLLPSCLSASQLPCPASQCPSSFVKTTQLGDGICDSSCMNSPCGYDKNQGEKRSSDCYAACVGLGCDPALLGDGKCDGACALAACGWDWGDCGFCGKNCID